MGQDVLLIAEQIKTQGPGGLTVQSGGSLAVQSGTLSVASGGVASIASGASLSLASGGVLTVPSMFVGAPGTSSSSIAVASGTSIPLTQGVVRVSATASTTSTTLTSGTTDGQQIVVLNESTNQVIVTGGIKNTPLTIGGSSACAFVWVSADTLWWHLT